MLSHNIFQKIFAFAVLAIPIAACANVDRAPSLCRSGWISDASGDSVLLELDQIEMQRLQADLGAEGQIKCVHMLPSGKAIAIQGIRMAYYAVEAERGPDGWREVNRSIILNFD